MRKAKTNILKTVERLDGSDVKDMMQERSSDIISFFKLLMAESTSFDAEAAFEKLNKYIGKRGRILYAPISNEIYKCYDENGSSEAIHIIGTILSNIEKLVEYIESLTSQANKNQGKRAETSSCLVDTQKAALKIWDHVNLAQQQYNVLKQSDDEYREKFDKLIAPYKEEMTKDMSNQLLTMVSIFTALAFLVFGGISSLDSIFSVQGIPLLKLLCVGALWGLCILNLIFVFLFCVSKMTKLDFRSTDDRQANIFQKYPVIWWTDLMLLSVLLLCTWAYYIQQHEIANWFVGICLSNPQLITLVGFGVIALIIVFACSWLAKKTSNRKR